MLGLPKCTRLLRVGRGGFELRALWQKSVYFFKSTSSGDDQKTPEKNPPGLPTPPVPTAAAVRSLSSAESKKIVKYALFGNMLITSAKGAVWLSTGSSAMLSEAIHSLVDSGNQALLLIGLHDSDNTPDKKHQYGYGRSIYFWSLVSALGTFWCGAGVSMWTSCIDLINPNLIVQNVGLETWGVLGFSFMVDGVVLKKTLQTLFASKPEGVPFLKYLRKIRDPTTLAVIMEDSAACLGVVMAVVGIGATQMTDMVIFDSIAGVGISGLLAYMGYSLAKLNQKYLVGHSVDPEITSGIRDMLNSRPSIDEVHGEQSQWIGPYAFAYKAEVDFDGTYLATKLLRRYENEFLGKKQLSPDEVKLLLAWYAEDVMRTVEQEVKDVEEQIRRKYPEALYIELEPDSKKALTYAIDDGREASLKRIEIETIRQLLKDQGPENETRKAR